MPEPPFRNALGPMTSGPASRGFGAIERVFVWLLNIHSIRIDNQLSLRLKLYLHRRKLAKLKEVGA